MVSAMASDSKDAAFATTCWSDVRRAASLRGGEQESLQQLCHQYWYPLYAFLRRAGHDPETAQDHVQSFFADLLSRKSLRSADPSRGRFRTFLLTACRNHVANRQRSLRSVRRGGGRVISSLDGVEGETRYACEPTDDWTAERLFERQWALSVIDAAFSRVRAEYEAKGRAERFDALRPLVAPAGSPPSHAEIAQQLGCRVESIKVAAYRLRQQFGDALREEIGRTVDVDNDRDVGEAIEEELTMLLTALGGG
jgi:RNA polymerase sigma factor (sigma-70 family)